MAKANAKRSAKKSTARAKPRRNAQAVALPDIDPEEELAKAQLADHIRLTIQRLHLKEAETAKLLRLDHAGIAALMHKELAVFTSERLMRFLIDLGQDVEIIVRAKPAHRERGHVRIVDAV